MKSRILCFLGLLVFLTLSYTLCLAGAELPFYYFDYQVSLTPDKTAASPGDTITCTYSATGESGSEVSVYYSVRYIWHAGDDIFNAGIKSYVTDQTSGSFSFEVPDIAESITVYIHVSSDYGGVTNECEIPVTGAQKKEGFFDIQLTFDEETPVAGEMLTAYCTLVQNTGVKYYNMNATYAAYYDDGERIEAPKAPVTGVVMSDPIVIDTWVPENAAYIELTVTLMCNDPDSTQQSKIIRKPVSGWTPAEITVRDESAYEGEFDYHFTEGATAYFVAYAHGNGLKYQWQYKAPSSGKWANSPAEGANTEILMIPCTKSRDGYQYRCVITDRNGHQAVTKATEMTVDAVLRIDRQPADVTVTEGTAANFTVGAHGDGLTYQWQYRTSSKGNWLNTTATGATTATLTVPGTLSRNGYQYRCIVGDGHGSDPVTSSAVTLTVQQKIKITAQPQDLTVSAGAKATFTTGATGDGLSYQWQYKTPAGSWTISPASGANTATVTVAVTAAKNGYQYRCVITDRFGKTATSSAAVLTVPTVLKITAQPTGKTAAVGSSVQFTVKASGDGLTWQWQYKTPSGSWTASPAAGANTATVTVPVTAAKNGYQYRCVVKDRYGKTVTSSAAALTVQAVLKITDQPTDKSAASGNNVQFSVKATGDGLTWQWQYKTPSGSWTASPAAGANTATLTVAVTASKDGYQYRCVVGDRYGEKVTSSAATLKVRQALTITAQPTDRNVAAGTSAKFTVKATGDGLTWQWQYRTSPTGSWAPAQASGATSATLTVPGSLSRNGYQYRCVITDKYGEKVTSSIASLTVK